MQKRALNTILSCRTSVGKLNIFIHQIIEDRKCLLILKVKISNNLFKIILIFLFKIFIFKLNNVSPDHENKKYNFAVILYMYQDMPFMNGASLQNMIHRYGLFSHSSQDMITLPALFWLS